MAKIQQLITNAGWVSEDGSWGNGQVIVFEPSQLTEQQWDTLDDLGDNDKYNYVLAVLNNEDLSEWEN